MPFISLPIAKVAGIAFLGATVAGVGVLSWAVIATNDGDDDFADANEQPAAQETATGTSATLKNTHLSLTPEQALVIAAQSALVQEATDVDIVPTTYGAARDATGKSMIFQGAELQENEPAWLATFTGPSSNRDQSIDNRTLPAGECITEYVYFTEYGYFITGRRPNASAKPSSLCESPTEISREMAIFATAKSLRNIYDPYSEVDVDVDKLPFGEAYLRVENFYGTQPLERETDQQETTWVVKLSGIFWGQPNQPEPGHIQVCGDIFAILSAITGDRILITSDYRDDCWGDATPDTRPLGSSQSSITADQAIVYAAYFSWVENLSHVDATLMTYAEARALTGNSTIIPGEPPGDTPVWLIAFTGRFFHVSARNYDHTTPPLGEPPCTTEYFYAVALNPIQGAVRADTCNQPDVMSHEVALFSAAKYTGDAVRYTVPSAVSAELLDASVAVERNPELGETLAAVDFIPGMRVWYVEITGLYKIDLSGASAQTLGQGGPTITPVVPACIQITVVLTEFGDHLLTSRGFGTGCEGAAAVTTAAPDPARTPLPASTASPVAVPLPTPNPTGRPSDAPIATPTEAPITTSPTPQTIP